MDFFIFLFLFVFHILPFLFPRFRFNGVRVEGFVRDCGNHVVRYHSFRQRFQHTAKVFVCFIFLLWREGATYYCVGNRWWILGSVFLTQNERNKSTLKVARSKFLLFVIIIIFILNSIFIALFFFFFRFSPSFSSPWAGFRFVFICLSKWAFEAISITSVGYC